MNAHRDFLRGAIEIARRQADTLDALAVVIDAHARLWTPAAQEVA